MSELLRHTLATLAHRADKALRDAPPDFCGFRLAPTHGGREQSSTRKEFDGDASRPGK